MMQFSFQTPRSKKLWFILLLCSGVTVGAQTVSYWWSQMLKKPDAAQSQAFFFLPGTNINFTYTNNRVVINSTGGGTNSFGGGLTTNFSVLFQDTGLTNMLYFTNGLLVAVVAPSIHGSSLIQPAGAGYLLQPGGTSTLLLP
jgi:hypothetical protein